MYRHLGLRVSTAAPAKAVYTREPRVPGSVSSSSRVSSGVQGAGLAEGRPRPGLHLPLRLLLLVSSTLLASWKTWSMRGPDSACARDQGAGTSGAQLWPEALSPLSLGLRPPQWALASCPWRGAWFQERSSGRGKMVPRTVSYFYCHYSVVIQWGSVLVYL